MKVLKVLVIILVILVGGYAAWMATIPADFKVEKTKEINAPASKVYSQVVDLTTWKNWSYWDLMDSTNVVTYDGTPGEIGASYSWEGDLTQKGRFEITELDANKKLGYDIEFDGQGGGFGALVMEENEGKTTVSYSFEMKFGFWDRIGSYFMDGVMGMAFDSSLVNLKSYIEALPADKPSYEASIELMENTPMAYYAVTDEIPMSDLNSEFFASRFGEVGQYLGKEAANLSGAPFAVYHLWDTENKMTKVSVALPVNSELEGNDRVQKGMTHEGTVLKGSHWGDYAATGELHMAIDKYAADNSFQIVGSPWEVYVTDPTTEADTSKWLTEIYYPVMKTEAEKAAE
tara:strand:+ start:9956 stop:10990 length:1035 start_codon:yes stop_codon:yes gene_type:complete